MVVALEHVNRPLLQFQFGVYQNPNYIKEEFSFIQILDSGSPPSQNSSFFKFGFRFTILNPDFSKAETSSRIDDMKSTKYIDITMFSDDQRVFCAIKDRAKE